MNECAEGVEKALQLHAGIVLRAKDFKKAEVSYEEKKRAYEGALNDYNSARRSVAIQEIMSRGETWCTKCKAVIQEKDTMHILLIGKRREKIGIEGGDYRYKAFSELHRMCQGCKEEARMKHGWYGKWDKTAEDQEEFHAHGPVEWREDLKMFILGGSEVALRDHGWKGKEEEFHNPTDSMIETMATELDLPPKRTYGDFV